MDGCAKYVWLNGWLSSGSWMDALYRGGWIDAISRSGWIDTLSRVGCVWMDA